MIYNMINGLHIYYSKNIGKGLKPICNKQTISQKANGLKPVSIKGSSCKKVGSGLRILQQI